MLFHRRNLLALAVALLATAGLGCSSDREAGISQDADADGTSSLTTQGITDTEIVLGAHFPLSQTTAAVYGSMSQGLEAYFADVNAKGGVYGRKIRLLIADDHYNPADALEGVRSLVEQDKVFAIVGGLGDAPHFTVARYLEEKGIPDLFFAAGMPELTDPVVKSRFAGLTSDYRTESKAGAKYLAEHYPGKRLGILTQSDEAGERGEQMAVEFLEEFHSGIQVVGVEKYDPTAVDVTAQAQRLKSANPDVVALLAHSGVTAAFIKTAREILNWDVPFYTPSVSSNEITVALAGEENAEGLVSPLYKVLVTQTELPAVQEHLRIMRQYKPNVTPTNITLTGQGLAELTVKAFQDAGPNPTAESVVAAVEAMRDFCCTVCLAPINYGPEDHRGTEAFTFGQVRDGIWVHLDYTVNYESTPGQKTSCVQKN